MKKKINHRLQKPILPQKKFKEKAKIGKITYAGSIGVKLGLISEGKADTYFTMSNKTCQWDIYAPEIILKEAGGKVTDLKGENFIKNFLITFLVQSI